MEYVEHAPLLPRSCFLCGQANGPFVDLQRDDDDTRVAVGTGDVAFGSTFHYYACARCAVSMAQMIAPAINITVINTDQFDELRTRLAVAEASLSTALSDNANLRSSIAIVEQGPPWLSGRVVVDAATAVNTDGEATPAPTRTPAKKAAAKK